MIKPLKDSGRNETLDWIAGLLTIVVILIHIELFTDDSLHFWKVWGERVFYFFMAWFFFKSGMFEKEYSFKETCWKVWKSLIIPYLFFSIVAWVIWIPQFFHTQGSVLLLIRVTLSRFIDLNIIPGNGPMWFLVALSGCRLIYPILKRFINSNYLISLIGYAGGYIYHLIYEGVTHEYVMLGIPLSSIALAFYALGAELRYKQYSKMAFILSTIIYVVTVIFSIPIIYFAYAGAFSSEISWICSLPMCVAGIVTWNNVVRLLPSVFFRFVNLGYIGKYSMTYYSAHWSIIITLVFLYNDTRMGSLGLPLQWTMIVACAVILPVADILLRRYMPWAVGAKPRVRKGVEVGAASDPLP